MKIIFLFFLCIGVWTVQAGSLVEGVIYLKNGRSIEFKGHDRLKIPSKHRDVKGVREAFAKNRRKEIYPMEEIDSVVCWHARMPEYQRKFLPSSQIGWCWVYFETPHMIALIYSKKGYGVSTNGGIGVYQRQGIFTHSKVKYYIRKSGGKEFYSPGKVKARTGKAFREKLCSYIADDEALCNQIRRSDTWRGKTLLLLKDYQPRN